MVKARSGRGAAKGLVSLRTDRSLGLALSSFRAPLREGLGRWTTVASNARDDAVRRLNEALDEQDRLGERYRGAIGTAREFTAYARLRAASDEVAARGAWLKSIEDDGADGRRWVNGHEVGGTDSLFLGLEASHV